MARYSPQQLEKARRVNPNPANKNVWRAPNGDYLPLKDGEQDLILSITPTQEDISCAVVKDPLNCALANAWKREHGVANASIGLTIAYLPMMENGEKVCLRMRVPRSVRREIEDFDRGGEFPEHGFFFHGINPSNKLESGRAYVKRSRDRWGKKGKGQPKLKHPTRNASRRAQVVAL